MNAGGTYGGLSGGTGLTLVASQADWRQGLEGRELRLSGQRHFELAICAKRETDCTSWTVEDGGASASSSSSALLSRARRASCLRQEHLSASRNGVLSKKAARCWSGVEIRASNLLAGESSNTAAASLGILAQVGSGIGNGSFLDLVPQSPAVQNRMSRNVVDLTDNEAVVRTLCKEGKLNEAIAFLDGLDQQGVSMQPRIFSSILKLCIRTKALETGKRVHGYIIKCGLETDLFLANILVNMYAKSGNIRTAQLVFDSMSTRDVISWTALISGSVVHGYIKDAFRLFKEMQEAGIKPTRVTFISMINACAILRSEEEGKRMHALVVENELEAAEYIANSLVNMYAKCGNMDEARKLFKRMKQRDTVSWNAMIAGYTDNSHGWRALDFFKRMQKEDITPDAYTFVSVFTACAALGALEQGKRIHEVCLRTGWHTKPIVANSLIDMYSMCGSIEDAERVFNCTRKHDLVSWNMMIKAYARHGLYDQAFGIFQKMTSEGLQPDDVTFVTILNACGTAPALDHGRAVHAYLHKTGFEADSFVWNALVDMYAKCGSIDDACDVFEKMPRHDVVSWNTLIAGYTQNGQPEASLRLFHRMEEEKVEPSAITFSSILQACTSLSALDEGKKVHASLKKLGVEPSGAVKSALVDMYISCGSLEDACRVYYNLPAGEEVPTSCLDSTFWAKRNSSVREKYSPAGVDGS